MNTLYIKTKNEHSIGHVHFPQINLMPFDKKRVKKTKQCRNMLHKSHVTGQGTQLVKFEKGALVYL